MRQTGALGALMQLFDEHLGGVCGLEVVDHVHFGSMVTGITEEAFAEVIGSVAGAVRTHFRREPAPAPA